MKSLHTHSIHDIRSTVPKRRAIKLFEFNILIHIQIFTPTTRRDPSELRVECETQEEYTRRERWKIDE